MFQVFESAYLIVAFRIFTIIPIVLVTSLLMGKRHISELPVFDFIIAIVLGSVVGADIADPSVDHGPTILAILLLVSLQIGHSFLTIRSQRFRHYTRFEPTIVIQNGIILKHNLRKIRFSLDQILSLLRLKNVFNVSDVEFALVEANGDLSVQKKSQQDYLKPIDSKTATPYRGLSTPLIYEGQLDQEMLSRASLNEQWLIEELHRQKISSIKDVFYAELDTEGNLYASPINPHIPEQKRLM